MSDVRRNPAPETFQFGGVRLRKPAVLLVSKRVLLTLRVALLVSRMTLLVSRMHLPHASPSCFSSTHKMKITRRSRCSVKNGKIRPFLQGYGPLFDTLLTLVGRKAPYCDTLPKPSPNFSSTPPELDGGPAARSASKASSLICCSGVRNGRIDADSCFSKASSAWRAF